MNNSIYPHNHNSIHQRIRSLLRNHSRAALLVDSEHSILISAPERKRRRLENANTEFHRNNESLTNFDTDNSQRPRIIDQLINTAQSNIQQISSNSSRGRPHILGYERAVIHFSSIKPDILAKSFRCSVDTIYRIQKDPLARYGITSRQLSSIIADLIDSNLMMWFSNASGVPDFVLPPADFISRGGANHKLQARHSAILKAILESQPNLYLDEIRQILIFLEPNLDISISTLSRHLLKMGYNRKKSSRVIDKSDHFIRSVFAFGISTLCTSLDQLVFLDECTNARNSLTRTYSRSPAKMMARGKTYIPSRRVSFIGAISSRGLVDFDLFPNTISSQEFTEFLTQNLLPRMNPYPQHHSILILDNARAHSPNIINYAMEHHSVIVLFLPPYSPDLNPIERFFASIKATFKRYVGNDPSLRRQPFLLWMMSLAHCDSIIRYSRLVGDTYQVDPFTDQINVIYD